MDVDDLQDTDEAPPAVGEPAPPADEPGDDPAVGGEADPDAEAWRWL